MYSLTHREKEIAILVAKGFRNREIAKHLTLSVKTIENYLV